MALRWAAEFPYVTHGRTELVMELAGPTECVELHPNTWPLGPVCAGRPAHSNKLPTADHSSLHDALETGRMNGVGWNGCGDGGSVFDQLEVLRPWSFSLRARRTQYLHKVFHAFVYPPALGRIADGHRHVL